MVKKYVVHLTDAERATLHQVLAAGKAAARTLTHAHILRQLPLLAKGAQAGPTSRSWKRSR